MDGDPASALARWMGTDEDYGCFGGDCEIGNMVAPALTLLHPLSALPAVPRPDWPRIWRSTLEDPQLLARLLRKRAYLATAPTALCTGWPVLP